MKPAIVQFLQERGLRLSEEKTVITHITEGFNFLGQNVRKYGDQLLTKPARHSVRSVLEKVRQTFEACRGHKASELIRKLNPVLRGWANYHRHVVSSRIFGRVDNYIVPMLRRWIRREHPNKSWRWIEQRYFAADPSGAFSVRVPGREGKMRVLSLYRVGKTKIERHIKVRANANPYDPAYTDYFEKRRCFAWRTYPVGSFRAPARNPDRPATQNGSPTET